MAFTLRKLVVLAFVAALATPVAGAVTLTQLYEVSQPVTTTREAAFADALRTVVVRVSGRRNAPEQLGAALADPRRFVQRFGFTAGDVLEVGFDDVSIDRLLTDAGLPIWGRERPATLVVLGIPDPAGGEQWVSAEAPPAARQVIETTAKERGAPLVWAPLGRAEQLQAADAVNRADPRGLIDLASAHGADATLVGRLRGSSVHWMLMSRDGSSDALGPLEVGVHMAADEYAGVYAASASSLGAVMVDVLGVSDLNAYAETLNYLENLTLVRSAAPEQAAGDLMRFRLVVRGDAATLRRAIALGDTLAAVETPGETLGGERLVFRYRR